MDWNPTITPTTIVGLIALISGWLIFLLNKKNSSGQVLDLEKKYLKGELINLEKKPLSVVTPFLKKSFSAMA